MARPRRAPRSRSRSRSRSSRSNGFVIWHQRGPLPTELEHPAASRPTNSRTGLRCCPSPAAAPPPACAAQTRTHGGTARAESTARLPRHVGEAATRRLLQLTDAAPGIPELLHTQRLYIARFTSGQQRWRQTACATAGCHLFGPFPRV